ncbi:MAG: 3-phosphoshikimate 1-carboxyvinyltransferase [Candidatus Dormiibacterota bacterium]
MPFLPAARLRGEIVVPGDKSISHRALVLAAMAQGRSRVEGRARGADQESMVGGLAALGVEIEDDGDVTNVHGVGLRGLATAAADIDCGNSGATMRFLAGAISGIEGAGANLVGDASLSLRPMDRVAEPLRRMGADVETGVDGRPPVRVTGRQLHGAVHHVDVASAQVKTAILLAALNADGETTITAPPSRDHTERLLGRLGVDIETGGTIRVLPPTALPAFEITVPGDPSSAAFWVVLAAAHPDAEVIVHNVCLNPTRAGFLAVLGRMGARIEMFDTRDVAGEAVADILVRSAALRGTDVEAGEIPSLVDEVPVLAVAAAMAEGETRFRGVGELRVKETNRLAAIAEQLGRLGIEAKVEADDLLVSGAGRLHGGELSSSGDHRMAMSLAVAASLADGPSRLAGAVAADVSYPDFYAELRSLSD